MFGSKQEHEAQSHAIAAWNEITEALGSTRDSASSRAKDLSSEAGRRVNGAWDVLAGRPAPTRTWPLIRMALFGVAVGWVAAALARNKRAEIDRTMTVVSDEIKQAKEHLDDRIARAKATPGGPVEKVKAVVNSSAAN